MSQTTAQIILLAIVLVGLVVYFVPAIVAFRRRHRQRVAILLLNFFLGWMLLGWVVALVWAATSDVEPRAAPVEPPPPAKTGALSDADRAAALAALRSPLRPSVPPRWRS